MDETNPNTIVRESLTLSLAKIIPYETMRLQPLSYRL